MDHRGTPDAPGRVSTLLERSYWETLTDPHHGPAPDKVWGVAFRIAADKVAEVKEYLDIREVGGYTIHYAPFHPAAGAGAGAGADADADADADTEAVGDTPSPFSALVYIGTPDNPQFTGPLDPDDLAATIFTSTGPSGRNRDYLWGLEQALDGLSPESGDEHVTDLSNRVRALAAAADTGASAYVPVPRQPEGEEQEAEDGGLLPVLQPTKPIMSSLPPVNHDFKKVSSIDEQEETEKSR